MMNENQKSRYVNQDAATSKGKLIALIALSVVMAIIILGTALYFLFDFLKAKRDMTATEQIAYEEQMDHTTPTAGKVEFSTIDTLYGTLKIEKEYLEKIRHDEIPMDQVTMEIFYMIQEEEEWELFRLYYGDTTKGNLIGKVLVDGQEIPVSVALNEKSADAYLREEALLDYYVLMEQINVVLDSVRSAENFIPLGAQIDAESPREIAQLKYWNVELPDCISWQESDSEGTYRVDFYGVAGDQNIRLYTISMGDKADGNILCMYEMDGEEIPVHIITYPLKDQISQMTQYLESEYATQMDSIDVLVQAITSAGMPAGVG